MVQCTDNMWRQNIDAIKWLIEPWFGAQTICEGLNIDVIEWLIKQFNTKTHQFKLPTIVSAQNNYL